MRSILAIEKPLTRLGACALESLPELRVTSPDSAFARLAPAVPVNDLSTPYPLVDADPYAGRVIRYFRPSDYALWAAGTAAAPAAIYAFQLADPAPLARRGLRPTLQLATWLGFAGGFLLAYQSSSLRLWGWKENGIEAARDEVELGALAKAGKALYGSSDLPEYVQGVAHRNSLWSQLKFGALPWFNLVHHNHHGVDTAKYGSKDE